MPQIGTLYSRGAAPRASVTRAFQVGDDVSYAFNGDAYSDGKITSISDSKRVIRTSGYTAGRAAGESVGLSTKARQLKGT